MTHEASGQNWSTRSGIHPLTGNPNHRRFSLISPDRNVHPCLEEGKFFTAWRGANPGKVKGFGVKPLAFILHR